MEALVERFGQVRARYDELGGYGLEARAREILAGLGFSPEAAKPPSPERAQASSEAPARRGTQGEAARAGCRRRRSLS